MADCLAKKPGLGKCFRNKGHDGKHLSFAENAKGFDKPKYWDADPPKKPTEGEDNGD